MTNNLKNKTETSNGEENESGNFRYERQNFRKPFVINESNTQVDLPKSNSIEYTNFETFSTQRENAVEIHKQIKSEDKYRTKYKNIEDVEYTFNQNGSAPFAKLQNQSGNDIGDDFPAEDFGQSDKKEVSQDFNISLSSSAIKDEESYVLESNEYMEFISDDENQNVEINQQSNSKIIVGSIQLEIKEQEDSQDFNVSSSAIKDEQFDSRNEHMEFISEDEHQNMEINNQSKSNIIVNLFEEVGESEETYTTNKTYNENEGQNDLYVEEVDDRSNKDLSSGDSNSLLEEPKITEFNNIEHVDSDDYSEQEDISSGTCSLEEKNLVDETILSEGYDQVNLNEYLDKVLKTQFQNLMLTCEMECKPTLDSLPAQIENLNFVSDGPVTQYRNKLMFYALATKLQELYLN